MTVGEALELFKSANKPSRRLDAAVAEILGWSRRFEIVTDPDTKSTKRVQKKVWLIPSGEEEKRVPAYSGNAQAALDALDALVKDVPCALVVTEQGARAQLWEQEIHEAPHVAMAICVAALTHLQMNSS